MTVVWFHMGWFVYQRNWSRLFVNFGWVYDFSFFLSDFSYETGYWKCVYLYVVEPIICCTFIRLFAFIWKIGVERISNAKKKEINCWYFFVRSQICCPPLEDLWAMLFARFVIFLCFCHVFFLVFIHELGDGHLWL